MFTQISKLLMDGMYSDIILLVNNKKYKAHRQILSNRSDYFKKIFSNNSFQIDLCDNQFILNFENNEAFEIILKYIYDIPIKSIEFELYIVVLKYLDFLLITPLKTNVITKKSVFILKCDSYSGFYFNDELIDFVECNKKFVLHNKYIDQIKKYMQSYGVIINNKYPVIEYNYTNVYHQTNYICVCEIIYNNYKCFRKAVNDNIDLTPSINEYIIDSLLTEKIN